MECSLCSLVRRVLEAPRCSPSLDGVIRNAMQDADLCGVTFVPPPKVPHTPDDMVVVHAPGALASPLFFKWYLVV